MVGNNVGVGVGDKITKHNSSIPKAYGLPKIHKPDVPLRIIVASYESPFYEISSFISDILNPLIIPLATNSQKNIFQQKILITLDPPNLLEIVIC